MTEQEERDTAPDQSTNPPADTRTDTEPAAAAEAPAAPAPEQEAPTAEPEAVAPEPETVEAAPAEQSAAPEADPPAEPVEAEAQAEAETPPETPPEAAPEAAPEAEAQAEPAEAEAPRPLSELAADARYFATGKRKSSVARVILMPGNGDFKLNGRALEVYFPRRTHQVVVRQPLEASGFVGRVNVVARIHGGGISGQADAVRHGIAKALIDADPTLRGELKRRQLLTRDPRVKERRKAGLKKARKRPQFSKR